MDGRLAVYARAAEVVPETMHPLVEVLESTKVVLAIVGLPEHVLVEYVA